MAYVPQFIPTNTQVLQGTLNQYQQAYDTETARMNQVADTYSALPTTNPYDTTEKNRLMDRFQKDVIEGLDKKYNHDRANTQYAKELASKIRDLRNNPLWTLVKERDQLDKTRQNVMANKGSDYYENFNPDTLKGKDPSEILGQLKSWKPMDLKDMERQVATNAKEHANSIRLPEQIRRPAPGVLEIINQTGFPDIESATNWLLNSKNGEGMAWLEQSVKGTGFEGHLNDPVVKSRAINAALSQLVGEPDRKIMGDPSYVPDSANSGDSNTPSGLVRIGTQSPIQQPFAVNELGDVKNLQSKIAELEKDFSANPTAEKENQLSSLRIQQDKINSAVNLIESEPVNQEIIVGLNRALNSKLSEYPATFIAGDKSQDIADIIKESFINTYGAGRSGIVPGATTKADIAVKVAEQLKNYVDPSRKVSPEVISSIARDLVDIGADWYKGKGNFPKGYERTIEKQINEKLKTGNQAVFGDYRLPPDMKPAEKTAIKDFLLETMHTGIPLEPEYLEGGKSGIMWKKDEADKLKVALSKPNTEVGYLFDNEDNVFIQAHNPGDEKSDAKTVTYKIDPAISGYDMLNKLVKMTGDPRFLNSIYSNFDIGPNKDFSFNGKNSYLSKTLGKYFIDNNGKADVDMFKDFRIRKSEDNIGNIQYEVYVGKDDTEPTIFPNKPSLFQGLAMARQDYNATVK